jgi:hypothetical protein
MRTFLIVAALALLASPGAALADGPIRGTAEGETITGTAGDDAIFARGGDDTVNALGGDDRVKGGRGEDTLDGGAGDDLIDGRGDGRAGDRITCGAGEDTVRASRNDEVAADCEHVKQPGAEPDAVEQPPFDDDGKPGNGPKGDELPPFDDDGKPGKGPKAAVAAAAPAAKAAKAACKDEKHAMGTRLFKQTYGAKSTSRAMEKCIDEREPAVAADAKNAAKKCKAERKADPAEFAETYGTSKNAYGKCVSGKAKDATEDETTARVNAAKTCKALRAGDEAEFEELYGTRKNAFGKCVSATARADNA